VPEVLLGTTYGEFLTALQDGTFAEGPEKAVKGIPLGIHRPSGAHGSAAGYVFTNPPPPTLLEEGDSIFVLAGNKFRDVMLDENGFLKVAAIIAKTQESWSGKSRSVIGMLGKVKSDTLGISGEELALANSLFERYNLDGSGYISTEGEFRQLVTNMIFTSQLPAEEARNVNHKLDQLKAMDLKPGFTTETFIDWYVSARNPVVSSPKLSPVGVGTLIALKENGGLITSDP